MGWERACRLGNGQCKGPVVGSKAQRHDKDNPVCWETGYLAREGRRWPWHQPQSGRQRGRRGQGVHRGSHPTLWRLRQRRLCPQVPPKSLHKRIPKAWSENLASLPGWLRARKAAWGLADGRQGPDPAGKPHSALFSPSVKWVELKGLGRDATSPQGQGPEDKSGLGRGTFQVFLVSGKGARRLSPFNPQTFRGQGRGGGAGPCLDGFQGHLL